MLSIVAGAGVSGSVYTAGALITATLKFAGLPSGVYVTSCSGYISDPATPVQLSLVRAGLEGGFPRITWYSADGSAPRATVYRRTADTEWSPQGEVVADGSGYLVYEDARALPGSRYGYRLGVVDGGEERALGETWVDVPASFRLALEDVVPNPAPGPFHLGFSLVAARPAWLEVFDLSGRRIHARDVGALGAGRHVLTLEESGTLPPGIYLLRLSQDNARVSRRVVKIR